MKNRDSISLESTRDLLEGDCIYGLAEALHSSVSRWREQYYAPEIQPGTRASIIGDGFYWNLTTLSLAGRDEMAVATINNQRFVSFNERVLLRCKHVDRGLESRNYPTPQAQDFVRQRQIVGFPEFDRLHLAYRLDPTGLFLRDAFVTLPIGRRSRFNDWVWQFWGESIESTSTYGLQKAFPHRAFDPERYYYEDFSTHFA